MFPRRINNHHFEIQNLLSRVTLGAGTRVKHGTTAENLLTILQLGIIPGFNRHKLRTITEEQPLVEAVYVGSLSAYFGAWAAASALTKQHELNEPNFTKIASEGDAALLKRGDYIDPPLAIPIVLVIELGEDTESVGDEDYALWKIDDDGIKMLTAESTSKGIWSRFISGGSIRSDGIPVAWIKKLEFPQLMRIDYPNESQFKRLGPD